MSSAFNPYYFYKWDRIDWAFTEVLSEFTFKSILMIDWFMFFTGLLILAFNYERLLLKFDLADWIAFSLTGYTLERSYMCSLFMKEFTQ